MPRISFEHLAALVEGAAASSFMVMIDVQSE